MDCPSCATPVADGDTFCTNCGTALATAPGNGVACPSCSAPVAAGDTFCTNCGSLVAAAPSGDWVTDFDRSMQAMATAIETAVAEHNAGRISLEECQQRCLQSGIVRVGDAVIIWDWMNAKFYGYDGFQVTELPGPGG